MPGFPQLPSGLGCSTVIEPSRTQYLPHCTCSLACGYDCKVARLGASPHFRIFVGISVPPSFLASSAFGNPPPCAAPRVRINSYCFSERPCVTVTPSDKATIHEWCFGHDFCMTFVRSASRHVTVPVTALPLFFFGWATITARFCLWLMSRRSIFLDRQSMIVP
jgi:hypothetical protein